MDRLLDPTPGRNNPFRVPAAVERAEGDPAAQAGVLRVIHVHGPLVVGSVTNALPEEQHMIASTSLATDEVVTADRDGTYVDAAGTPYQFRKGDRLPPGLTRRAEPAAPENRAITEVSTPESGAGPPENRTETAAQRKAREKAEKDAADKVAADAANGNTQP